MWKSILLSRTSLCDLPFSTPNAIKSKNRELWHLFHPVQLHFFNVSNFLSACLPVSCRTPLAMLITFNLILHFPSLELVKNLPLSFFLLQGDLFNLWYFKRRNLPLWLQWILKQLHDVSHHAPCQLPVQVLAWCSQWKWVCSFQVLLFFAFKNILKRKVSKEEIWVSSTRRKTK